MKTKTLDGLDLDALIAEAQELADQADDGTLPHYSEDPIVDDDTANRQMWSLHYRKQELGDLEERFDEDIRKLREAKADLTRGLKTQVEWLEARLKDFHRYLLKKDPTRLSHKMPSGVLASTAGRWSIDETINDQAVTDTAERLGERLKQMGGKAAEAATEQPRFVINRAKLVALIDVGGKGHDSRPFGLTADGEIVEKDTGQIYGETKVTQADRTHRVNPIQ